MATDFHSSSATIRCHFQLFETRASACKSPLFNYYSLAVNGARYKGRETDSSKLSLPGWGTANLLNYTKEEFWR